MDPKQILHTLVHRGTRGDERGSRSGPLTDEVIGRSARAQARLRIALSVPIIVLGMLVLQGMGKWPDFAWMLVTVHAAYFTGAFWIAFRGRPMLVRVLSYATAVLDPLVLSIWMGLLGEFGAVFVGFFLFTILGFGFRAGITHMALCTGASIAAFVGVFVWGRYWSDHAVIWLGFLITLIAVPVYAAALLRRLNEARYQAERASQSKSDMITRVSHELRTPLCGIVSAAELMLHDPHRPDAARHPRTILTLSHELLREINNLLDESKYEAHALRLASEPVSLAEQAELLHAALGVQAADKGLVFRVLIDPRLPSHVEADSHHLGRVLLNLAGNAVKFTDRGEVKVAIELNSRVGRVCLVRFSVKDTGPGIPKEYHERLFTPFFQVAEQHRSRGGTGLGLSISRAIVQLMGGRLTVESEPKRGSVFSFEVPLAVAEAPRAEVAGAPCATQNMPRRVLIVDDNRTNLGLLKAMLEIDGHLVSTAECGQSALEKLMRESFDMVFLDFHLGDMTGEQLLQLYRFSSGSCAPVYFLTADASAVTQSQLRATQAAGVLTKPVSLEELRQTIAQVPVVAKLADDASVAGSGMLRRRPKLAAVMVSPIDLERIESLTKLVASPEFLSNLLDSACADIKQCCAQVISSLGSGDHDALREATHALRGVCANVGAVRLAAVVTAIRARHGGEPASQDSKLVADLREAERVTLAAFAELKGHDPVSLAREHASRL